MAPLKPSSLFLLVVLLGCVTGDLYEHVPATVFTVPVRPINKQVQLDRSAPPRHAHIHPMVYPDITPGQITKYGKTSLQILGNTVEYFVVVLLGTPGQPFSLQIDTGSAITAIPSAGCQVDTSTGSQDCYSYNPKYNSSASSTARVLSCKEDACTSKACNSDGTCSIDVSYGDKSRIQGRLVSDMLTIPATYTINSRSGGTIGSLYSTVFDNTPVIFGEVEHESSQFQQAGADGIMGLSFGNTGLSCVPNCASLVMDVLVSKYSIADIFSIALQPIHNNSRFNNPGGSLTLGGIDSNALGDAKIFYTPVVKTPFYSVAMGDILVGGNSIGASMDDFGSAVVDSGTTYTIIPEGPYTQMKRAIQGNCSLPFVCGDVNIFDSGHCVNASTIDLSVFPDLTIVLDQVKLVMPPSQYFVLTQVGSSYTPYYCLGVVNGGSNKKTILGDTFMHGYYTIFDRGNKRVGFANSALVSQGPRVVAPSNSVPIAIIAGAAAGGAAVILAVVALVVTIRIRRSARVRAEKSTADIATTVT